MSGHRSWVRYRYLESTMKRRAASSSSGRTGTGQRVLCHPGEALASLFRGVLVEFFRENFSSETWSSNIRIYRDNFLSLILRSFLLSTLQIRQRYPKIKRNVCMRAVGIYDYASLERIVVKPLFLCPSRCSNRSPKSARCVCLDGPERSRGGYPVPMRQSTSWARSVPFVIKRTVATDQPQPYTLSFLHLFVIYLLRVSVLPSIRLRLRIDGGYVP